MNKLCLDRIMQDEDLGLDISKFDADAMTL